MLTSKNLAILTWIVIFAFGAMSFIKISKHKILSERKVNTKGFAVVELFTSEGCSSCPPADELVAKIQKESKDLPVFILAFHVDYWNRLGWVDQFSSAVFTQRQNQYASWLHASVYTPQAVVNGSKEFIGSEGATMRNSIKSALRKSSETVLMLNDVKIDRGKIELHYQTSGQTKNTSLLLALVQKSAISNVKSGENSGRTLTHVQIVRKFQNIDISAAPNGTASIDVPEGFSKDSFELIAFLQKNGNGEIIVATKAVLDDGHH